MCPSRQITTREDPVDSPRCNIWWHLMIVFGLIGLSLLGLGGGWLYNANLGRNNEKRVEVMEYQLLERTRALDEIKGDVKELLRRNNTNRVSSVDAGGGG